jgi:hypothetical protein
MVLIARAALRQEVKREVLLGLQSSALSGRLTLI